MFWKTMYAAPLRSTAIENGAAAGGAGQPIAPMRRKAPVGGLKL